MEAVSRENTPRYIEVEGHESGNGPQHEGPFRGDERGPSGDPGASGGGFLFAGPSEMGESTVQQPSQATGAAHEAGGPSKDSLYLHEDQQAENPLESQQPVSANLEPLNEEPRGQEGTSSSAVSAGAPPQGQATEPHFQGSSERQEPVRPVSESAAVATTAAARNTLKRATTSMREGVKSASAQVVHAGEKVGAVWNKTLDSAMWVCAACGALAILLIALSLALRTWRHQHLPYTDGNGENIARVELGLRSLQRIQTLHRKDSAGTIIIYDPPLLYQDAIESAYCVPDEDGNRGRIEEPPQETAANKPNEDSSNAQEENEQSETPPPTEERPQEEEPELSGQVEPTLPEQLQQQLQQQLEQLQEDDRGVGSAAGEAATGLASAEDAPATAVGGGSSFLSRRLQASSSLSPAKRRGPLANPPPFSVTLGRNPGAPGSLTQRYAEMREDLLGPTLFDLHCKDLERFKKSGALFGRMAVAYLVFAGVGMAAAAASLLLTSVGTAWAQRMQDLPVNLIGTVAWLVALVLQLCGLASWGVGTDVAACVTSSGGAAVCTLGSAAALAIGSLVLTLIATLSYCLFFTHKFIRDLGLEKQRENKRAEMQEAEQQQNQPEIKNINKTQTEEDLHPAFLAPQTQSLGGGPQPKQTPDSSLGAPAIGGPHTNSMGGPHLAVLGESETPIRSITEGSQALRH
ncbi:hypothetical protein, conserved [Eimeria acervulina]|uniref:Transmembrane protein n=1 Tax=Eimeria acervulina TaxID=5801 RepID=U6GDA2_EIMAC|nr:hypothetical protein, conserved [Eimeria acervulina]CDI76539.1 hypothetical protein, conserved [Eimeria acervulina]